MMISRTIGPGRSAAMMFALLVLLPGRSTLQGASRADPLPLPCILPSIDSSPAGRANPRRFDGSRETTSGIQGDIELAVCFEVVPGSAFAFDLDLWNPGTSADTAVVMLRLGLPDGHDRMLLNFDVVLAGGESFSRGFTRLVPEDLDLYGRYTMALLIDDLLTDSFEFDLNSRDEIIVRWDDGVLVFPDAWYESGNIWAIKGCMPDGSVIDEVGARLLSEDDPYWPWPDAVHQAVELRIYDDDGPGGMPGTLLWSSGEIYADPSNGEASAFPGIPAPASSFYVGDCQLTPYPTCEGQGQDGELDYPDRMFARVGGNWQNAADLLSGDLMIWAVGRLPLGRKDAIGLPLWVR